MTRPTAKPTAAALEPGTSKALSALRDGTLFLIGFGVYWVLQEPLAALIFQPL